MRALDAKNVTLHVQEAGDPIGAPVLFANSLGTDLRLWDALIPLLPGGMLSKVLVIYPASRTPPPLRQS